MNEAVHLAGVAPDAATGVVREMYDEDVALLGYVATDTLLFSLQPEVYRAWEGLARAVRKTMRLRRYELLTLATARALGCRACMSAHAAMCIKHGVLTTDEVEAILRDFHDARLDDVEVALMDLVEKVATDAQRVTASDVELLRGLGLRDDEIFAAVVVATARCFYSKALEAMGVPPSPELVETNALVERITRASPTRAVA